MNLEQRPGTVSEGHILSPELSGRTGVRAAVPGPSGPPPTNKTLHVPNVVTDGGPWAEHDQACAVCSKNHAVLDLDTGHFEPCWECQLDGWKLAQRRKWWRLAKRAR